jgi:NADPH:quinone reductase-like Zn-dependent oxidoreductase
VDTMMALRAHARGGPGQLRYEQAPAPAPGPGEALVAVHAAAITFAELTWDLSWTTKDGRDRTPVIPSHEMSGTVAGIADGVAVGDEVYGLIDFDRDGAAAEYVTLPAGELAARSRSVSDAQTATLPLAALTAWQALVDYAAVEPGERILVQGGTGGVGAFAVQLATFLGGRVIATGRGADDGFVRSLGAERFVSTANGRLANEVSGVVTPDAAALARLASLVDDGKLRTIISQSFPLRDGRHAFESGAHPRPPGKTVLILR